MSEQAVLIAVAVIAAGAPTAAVIIAAMKSGQKLDHISMTVNSNLARALSEIEALKSEISGLKFRDEDGG